MKEIISKELLSAILKRDVTYVDKHIPTKEIHCNISNSDLYYEVCRYVTWNSINVYELMANAIEWALEPNKGVVGFNIHIEPIHINDKIKYVSHVESRNGFTIFDGQDEILIPEYSTGIVDTMYTATFQACQWIYDNKVKGKSND